MVTRTPGFTDLHVLLAADAWDRGDKAKALSEWDFACETITTGCKKYKDVDGWLTEVRRWPPALVEAQRSRVRQLAEGQKLRVRLRQVDPRGGRVQVELHE